MQIFYGNSTRSLTAKALWSFFQLVNSFSVKKLQFQHSKSTGIFPAERPSNFFPRFAPAPPTPRSLLVTLYPSVLFLYGVQNCHKGSGSYHSKYITPPLIHKAGFRMTLFFTKSQGSVWESRGICPYLPWATYKDNDIISLHGYR